MQPEGSVAFVTGADRALGERFVRALESFRREFGTWWGRPRRRRRRRYVRAEVLGDDVSRRVQAALPEGPTARYPGCPAGRPLSDAGPCRRPGP